jgi:hypothetical protein
LPHIKRTPDVGLGVRCNALSPILLSVYNSKLETSSQDAEERQISYLQSFSIFSGEQSDDLESKGLGSSGKNEILSSLYTNNDLDWNSLPSEWATFPFSVDVLVEILEASGPKILQVLFCLNETNLNNLLSRMNSRSLSPPTRERLDHQMASCQHLFSAIEHNHKNFSTFRRHFSLLKWLLKSSGITPSVEIKQEDLDVFIPSLRSFFFGQFLARTTKNFARPIFLIFLSLCFPFLLFILLFLPFDPHLSHSEHTHTHKSHTLTSLFVLALWRTER